MGTPRQRKWSLWEHQSSDKNKKKDTSYNDLDVKLCDFGTVEEFWEGYQNRVPSLECVGVRALPSFLFPFFLF